MKKTKLSRKQKNQVIQMYISNIPRKVIAKAYGVSTRTIYSYIQRYKESLQNSSDRAKKEL
jgi:transposase